MYTLYTYMVHLSGRSLQAQVSAAHCAGFAATSGHPAPSNTQHLGDGALGVPKALRSRGRGPSWNQLTLQFRVHQGLGEKNIGEVGC